MPNMLVVKKYKCSTPLKFDSCIYCVRFHSEAELCIVLPARPDGGSARQKVEESKGR